MAVTWTSAVVEDAGKVEGGSLLKGLTGQPRGPVCSRSALPLLQFGVRSSPVSAEEEQGTGFAGAGGAPFAMGRRDMVTAAGFGAGSACVVGDWWHLPAPLSPPWSCSSLATVLG